MLTKLPATTILGIHGEAERQLTRKGPKSSRVHRPCLDMLRPNLHVEMKLAKSFLFSQGFLNHPLTGRPRPYLVKLPNRLGFFNWFAKSARQETVVAQCNLLHHTRVRSQRTSCCASAIRITCSWRQPDKGCNFRAGCMLLCLFRLLLFSSEHPLDAFGTRKQAAAAALLMQCFAKLK